MSDETCCGNTVWHGGYGKLLVASAGCCLSWLFESLRLVAALAIAMAAWLLPQKWLWQLMIAMIAGYARWGPDLVGETGFLDSVKSIIFVVLSA